MANKRLISVDGLARHVCLESTGYKESFLLGGRFGDYLLKLRVGRASCNKAVVVLWRPF